MSEDQKKSFTVFSATFCAIAIFVLGVAVSAGIEKNQVKNNTKNIERLEDYARDELKYIRIKLDNIEQLLR